MARVIILDTFPLSTAKREPPSGQPLTQLDHCHQWIKSRVEAGDEIVVPAVTYYEVLRELERLSASSQIRRLRAFIHAAPGRYLSLTDEHLELGARLWAQARNSGLPTASPDALDGDVLLAAQALSLGLPTTEFVIATTNVGHLDQFVPARLWADMGGPSNRDYRAAS